MNSGGFSYFECTCRMTLRKVRSLSWKTNTTTMSMFPSRTSTKLTVRFSPVGGRGEDFTDRSPLASASREDGCEQRVEIGKSERDREYLRH